MADQAEQRTRSSTALLPFRAFGRIMGSVFNGAKSAVQKPLRPLSHRRSQKHSPVQVACTSASQMGLQQPHARGSFLETLDGLKSWLEGAVLPPIERGHAEAASTASQPPGRAQEAEAETSTSGISHVLEGVQQGLERLPSQLQRGVERFPGQLQDSADYLKGLVPFQSQGTAGFLKADCFPPRLIARESTSSLPGVDEAQELITVGSRDLLRLKLYDFAIYLDRKQVQKSQLGKKVNKSGTFMPERDLALGIRDSKDVDMALMVRAARNLPIMLLVREYEHILKRRLRVVGGSPNDPALQQMLDTFRENALPADIRQGGSVRKGTVITFVRTSGGNILARADNHDLAQVYSPHLSQAVFDIYLGKQVVSQPARKAASDSFIRMLSDAEFEALDDKLVCKNEACRVGRFQKSSGKSPQKAAR